MKFTKVIISTLVVSILCLCGCLGDDDTIYLQDYGVIVSVIPSEEGWHEVIKVFFEDGTVENYVRTGDISIDGIYEQLKPLENSTVTIVYYFDNSLQIKRFIDVVVMDELIE